MTSHSETFQFFLSTSSLVQVSDIPFLTFPRNADIVRSVQRSCDLYIYPQKEFGHSFILINQCL